MSRRSFISGLVAAVLGSALLVCTGSALAQLRLTPGERERKNAEYLRRVGTFCRLDFDGARLSGDGWSRLQPLTTWRENPEFQGLSVVSRYQILTDVREERGRGIVSVQYEVVGRYDLHEGYLPDPGPITAQYEIDDTGSGPRISDIDPQRPFVGRARFEQWMEAKIETEKDPSLRALFEASLRRFQQQNSKSSALK